MKPLSLIPFGGLIQWVAYLHSLDQSLDCCGGVLRDRNCNIAAIFSSLFGVLDSNEAELLAIRHALKFFKNSRKNIGKEINVDVVAIGLVEFSNIFREANGMANALAKVAFWVLDYLGLYHV
ncbi:hypothetical protein REPUB_Repub06bG0120700 [Reevesia pubescens]